jgi:C4-dicarboxylate-specific signal transduction histidine kinase
VGGGLFRRELAAARERAEAAAALARSEQRRATSERLAVVGRLAAGVAHEINNPLGFVRANVAFVREALQAPARRRGPDDAELEHALSDVELGVERIRRIVADLRGFAREDRDEPCGVAPAAALEEALRLSSLRTRGMRVAVHAPQPLGSVRMCRKRLVQVLVNLLVNAADAVDEAEGDDRRWIEVTVEPRPGLVLFRVEDGGIGLSEEALRHLFEPFFTTKPQGAGTGLGLALAHEYATAVGGRLSARNGQGGGAVFELEVPLQDGEGGCGCGACGRDPARTPPPRLAAGG